jgi:hypothetical protein
MDMDEEAQEKPRKKQPKQKVATLALKNLREQIQAEADAPLPTDKVDAIMRAKLSRLAAGAADALQQMLDAGEVKAKDLIFLMAVAEDKRARLDGRNQMAGATVNIQINNVNTRDGILESLGMRKASAIEVEPA